MKKIVVIAASLVAVVAILFVAGRLTAQSSAAQSSQSAAAQPSAPQPSLPVRFIVSQRVLTESAEAKAELTKIQAAQQRLNNELRSRQQTLETTRRQLSTMADATERTRLQQQEQTQRADLERATTQAQNDMQALRRDMQIRLQSQLKIALDQLLKGQDVQVVLNADAAVVWSAPGLDITSTVIERLNALPPAAPAK